MSELVSGQPERPSNPLSTELSSLFNVAELEDREALIVDARSDGMIEVGVRQRAIPGQPIGADYIRVGRLGSEALAMVVGILGSQSPDLDEVPGSKVVGGAVRFRVHNGVINLDRPTVRYDIAEPHAPSHIVGYQCDFPYDVGAMNYPLEIDAASQAVE